MPLIKGPNLLKSKDLLSAINSGGSPRAGTHDGARYNARQSIFPTGSPRASGQKKAPPKSSSPKDTEKVIKTWDKKASPLYQVREKANKVYGDTYFENHYPTADQDLKTAIDEMVMAAHSRLRLPMDKEAEEEAPKEAQSPMQPIMVVLNIGDMVRGGAQPIGASLPKEQKTKK